MRTPFTVTRNRRTAEAGQCLVAGAVRLFLLTSVRVGGTRAFERVGSPPCLLAGIPTPGPFWPFSKPRGLAFRAPALRATFVSTLSIRPSNTSPMLSMFPVAFRLRVSSPINMDWTEKYGVTQFR